MDLEATRKVIIAPDLAPKNKPGKNTHIICSSISESWWQTEPFDRKRFWEWKNKAQQIVCQG